MALLKLLFSLTPIIALTLIALARGGGDTTRGGGDPTRGGGDTTRGKTSRGWDGLKIFLGCGARLVRRTGAAIDGELGTLAMAALD